MAAKGTWATGKKSLQSARAAAAAAAGGGTRGSEGIFIYIYRVWVGGFVTKRRREKVGGEPKNHPRAAGSSQDGEDVRTSGRRTVTSEEVGQPKEAPESVR